MNINDMNISWDISDLDDLHKVKGQSLSDLFEALDRAERLSDEYVSKNNLNLFDDEDWDRLSMWQEMTPGSDRFDVIYDFQRDAFEFGYKLAQRRIAQALKVFAKRVKDTR